MPQKDERVEVARLQSEISDLLGLDNDSLVFEYTTQRNTIRLDLVTINPVHNQSFLFHSVEAINKEDALKKMLDYVQKNFNNENSYTIQWTANGTTDLNTSFFRAKNMYEALDKLYYGRDMNTMSVFFIKLNPIS